MPYFMIDLVHQDNVLIWFQAHWISKHYTTVQVPQYIIYTICHSKMGQNVSLFAERQNS